MRVDRIKAATLTWAPEKNAICECNEIQIANYVSATSPLYQLSDEIKGLISQVCNGLKWLTARCTAIRRDNTKEEQNIIL